MDSGWGLVVYAGLKFLAYVMWCYVGVGLLRYERTFRAALGYGTLRLLIGVFFGISVFLVGGMAHLETPQNAVLMYLEIYVPVRWIEWGIIAALLRRQDAAAVPFLIGGDNKARLWRFGGIMVSIFADLPVLLTGLGAREMLPVGRFLC